jgi:hypothetical protein
MSTRHNDGGQSEHHQQAAELHDLAAHTHLSAAYAHEMGDHATGQERSRLALEHSSKALEFSRYRSHEGVEPFGRAEVAVLAHEIWEKRGGGEGHAEQDWAEAAMVLRARAG